MIKSVKDFALIILIAILSLTVATLFGLAEQLDQKTTGKNFQLTRVDSCIFMDEHTGVLYYGTDYAMTVLYNADGSLQLITDYRKSQIEEE